MPSTPKGLSDEKAARVLVAFREGRTLRQFAMRAGRFDAYCKAHPEYAREALPLLEETETGLLVVNLKVTNVYNKNIFASTLSDQFRTSSNWRKERQNVCLS